MTNIESALNYEVLTPETINGSYNKIKTCCDITVEGCANRVQATVLCNIRVLGNNNTIYGNGGVYIKGRNNVVSSSAGSRIVFYDEIQGKEYSKVLTLEEAGCPFALIEREISPVIRYRKNPVVATKIKTCVLRSGEPIDFYRVQDSLTGVSLVYCTNPLNDFLVVWDENAALAKIQTMLNYNAIEEELTGKILNKIKNSQSITYAEIMLLGLCENTVWQSAIKESEARGIAIENVGTTEFSIIEALQIIDKEIELVNTAKERYYAWPIIEKIRGRALI